MGKACLLENGDQQSILLFQISMAVCSILYQASTRLKQQEKMAEEIARVLPDPSKPLTYGDLDKLHYTKAFVREVFR